MKRSLQIGYLLLTAALAVSFASAQSQRADISWLAGGHEQSVSVAYSLDGTMLASSGYFGDSIKLWRTSDGAMIRTFSTTNTNSFIFGPMTPVTFFPDGRTIIALGEGGGPGIWNAADGRLLRKLNAGGGDLALNPDGTLAAVAASSSIKLVRPGDGVIVRTIPWPSNFVNRVALSLDGTVVAGGDSAGMIRTFRVVDGAPLLTIPAHSNAINALRYSPDGTRFASASSDTTVKLWNSTTGEFITALTGHTSWVNSIAFSPDGTLLASGSSDNTAKLWSMPGGTLVTTLSQPSLVNSLNFNPSSTRLAVGCQRDLREWDVPSQTLIRDLLQANDRISGTRFTPDSTTLVSGSYDGKLSVHDVATGALLRQMVPGGNVFSVATSANTAAAGINVPNVVKLYRLSDGALLHTLFPGAMSYNRCAAFSPDGATLATGHFGNTGRLWDVASGTLLQTLGTQGASGDLNALAYTSDGSLIAGASSDGFVRLWNTNGILIRSMGPVGQALSSVAISPDNQFVLAGGQSGLLQLWRIDTGAFVYSFTNTGGITDVHFTPSGFAFYAGRNDGTLFTNSTLRVYRTSDHALLETYKLETAGFGNNPAGPLSVDVSPDGKHVAYGRDDATVVMAHNTLIAAPTFATLFRGQLVSGSFQDLVMADGTALVARSGVTSGSQLAPVQLDIRANSLLPNPTRLSFQIVASASIAGLQQQIWMWNVEDGIMELVDARPATTVSQSVRVDLGPNFSRFIDAAGNVVSRVKWSVSSPIAAKTWETIVDQAVWTTGL